VAILVGVGIPSFVQTVDRNAVTGTANDLLSSVLIARSEAVKRETRVYMRRDADWSHWQVYTDEGNDGGAYVDGTDVLLVDHYHDGPVPTGNGAVATSLGFSTRGRTISSLSAATDFFQVTQGDHTRFLCFSAIGRPRVQEEACP
jgi:type IV fimbrial biogenesis protein FimT